MMQRLTGKALAAFVMLCLVVIGVVCSVDPGPAGARGVEWDPRLDGLNVTLHGAADCAEGCWRLESARFEDVNESGGNHHIYGRLTLQTGDSPGGLPWHAAYPDGDVRILTKPAPEWADFPMFAEYDPDEGEAGPYYAYAGDDPARSDMVRGMGLPERQHVNFRLVWRRVEGGATATVTPCVECRRLYLPIIKR